MKDGRRERDTETNKEIKNTKVEGIGLERGVV